MRSLKAKKCYADARCISNWILTFQTDAKSGSAINTTKNVHAEAAAQFTWSGRKRFLKKRKRRSPVPAVNAVPTLGSGALTSPRLPPSLTHAQMACDSLATYRGSALTQLPPPQVAVTRSRFATREARLKAAVAEQQSDSRQRRPQRAAGRTARAAETKRRGEAATGHSGERARRGRTPAASKAGKARDRRHRRTSNKAVQAYFVVSSSHFMLQVRFLTLFVIVLEMFIS
nr:uncharacterized protein LOC120366091 [Saimiri boliviensis boliviensis]